MKFKKKNNISELKIKATLHRYKEINKIFDDADYQTLDNT